MVPKPTLLTTQIINIFIHLGLKKMLSDLVEFIKKYHLYNKCKEIEKMYIILKMALTQIEYSIVTIDLMIFSFRIVEF